MWKGFVNENSVTSLNDVELRKKTAESGDKVLISSFESFLALFHTVEDSNEKNENNYDEHGDEGA